MSLTVFVPFFYDHMIERLLSQTTEHESIQIHQRKTRVKRWRDVKRDGEYMIRFVTPSK